MERELEKTVQTEKQHEQDIWYAYLKVPTNVSLPLYTFVVEILLCLPPKWQPRLW